MYILGISAYYHDSAAALLHNGLIIAAAQEERFTRKKNDASFPVHAIRYCLDEANINFEKLEAIVFYDKPFLKFERLLETYYATAPKGIRSFIKAMPIWIKEKLFLKDILYRELNAIGNFDKKKIKLLFSEHHLSHAASAFYPSGFNKAAILTIDGVGEWSTATIAIGEGKKITILKELHFPHSLGLLYSAFTYYLGFKVNSGEYKLMGLAPYGQLESEEVNRFKKIIRENLIEIADDGSLWLHQKYFSYATGLKMVKEKKWEKLFGISKRQPESDIEQRHANLALAIQQITEEIVIKMVKHTIALTQCKNICMAGGVALNCVANGKILKEQIVDQLFIQPAAGDAGGALGAALAVYHLYYNKERKITNDEDSMQGSLLGPSIHEKDILKIINRHSPKYERCTQSNILYQKVAEMLSQGLVVGWVQGRMEFGPRALGNRSILGDARNPEMQKKMNLKIKYRESFRPFAPAVLVEDSGQYFDLNTKSPYMLFIANVNEGRRKELPANYSAMEVMSRLAVERSDIPAVTHIDFSARIQTVDKTSNERFWQLINAFKSITGCCLLVNTSFNVRGEPIVCSADDAYRCFMKTDMDILVINDYIFYK